MLLFIWETSDEVIICENSLSKPNFGMFAGCELSNNILTGKQLGNVHYYIYVGF